jgi:hypothetical protein
MAFLGGKVFVHSKFASTGTTMSRRFSSQAAPTPSPLACFKFRFVSSPPYVNQDLKRRPGSAGLTASALCAATARPGLAETPYFVSEQKIANCL